MINDRPANRYLREASDVAAILRDPDGALPGLSQRRIGNALHLARRLGLGERLSIEVLKNGIELDSKIQHAMESWALQGNRHLPNFRLELTELAKELSQLDIRGVLLKGTAYGVEGHPASEGRRLGDIDLLVSVYNIDKLHQTLLSKGWQLAEDNYANAEYYREWMHEYPALYHPSRMVVLDIHHAILPPTDRMFADPALLLADSRKIGDGRYWALSPTDQILHAAAHLFRNGRFQWALRDLFDIHQLIACLPTEDPNSKLWENFASRAEQLGLTAPLHWALHFTREIYGDESYSAGRDRLERRTKPSWPISKLFPFLVENSISPSLWPGKEPKAHHIALWILKHWPLPRTRAVFSKNFWLRKVGTPQ